MQRLIQVIMLFMFFSLTACQITGSKSDKLPENHQCSH